MALRSFGRVDVAAAGTPVQVTTDRTAVHAVFIQQITGNTGVIHIGISALMDPATGVDMVATLPIPTANVLPSWSSGVDHAPASMDLREIWIDAGVNGDDALVSYVEA